MWNLFSLTLWHVGSTIYQIRYRTCFLDLIQSHMDGSSRAHTHNWVSHQILHIFDSTNRMTCLLEQSWHPEWITHAAKKIPKSMSHITRYVLFEYDFSNLLGLWVYLQQRTQCNSVLVFSCSQSVNCCVCTCICATFALLWLYLYVYIQIYHDYIVCDMISKL